MSATPNRMSDRRASRPSHIRAPSSAPRGPRKWLEAGEIFAHVREQRSINILCPCAHCAEAREKNKPQSTNPNGSAPSAFDPNQEPVTSVFPTAVFPFAPNLPLSSIPVPQLNDGKPSAFSGFDASNWESIPDVKGNQGQDSILREEEMENEEMTLRELVERSVPDEGEEMTREERERRELESKIRFIQFLVGEFLRHSMIW